MAVQINVQASQSALAQSISQGVAAYNARFASQNQLNLQINPRTFSQPLGRITSDLADFESALKASNARVLAFGASTAVLGGSVKVFKEIANITIEIEKSLTDVNRVLGLSTSGLQKFSTELFSISKQTASSFDDATKAALEFSRQGLNTQETLKRTADALTLVRLTGISSRQAVEDLTSTINGFSKAGLTTSQVVNKLAAVEQDFAVSASDLTEALSRTGQAAQEAGVGFDELNALVTTAQQSTARGGAVIGNALKTIFTRLQRTDTLEQLENFNISVRDIEGNILPATQILKNFADQYKNLADSQRAQLSEQVAGVYQVNILKGIIGDLSNAQGTYTKALERGAMASNEADIANQKLNKTLSALSTQTGLGLQQLANNIGKVTFAPIFEAIVSPINDAVTYINETLEGEGPGSIFANGLLKGIRNVITGPGLAVAFAVIAKVAKNTFEDATKALPAILGITTEAQRRANIEKSILAILQTQSTLSLALQGQQGNATAQAATVLNYAKLQTAQYQQQLQIAQQLAPLLAAQNVTIGARGVQVGAKIKAGGHIPAFAEMSERMGAAMGGYKSGKVVKAPKSVGANTYMNTAEETKYVPGFAQPFINPPAGSKAGRAHRQNAINRTGVDPYMAGGFTPNFALTSSGTEFSREWGSNLNSKIKNNPLVTSKSDIGPKPKKNDLFAADITKKQLSVSIDAIRKEATDVVKDIYLKKRDRTGELSGLAYQPEKLRAFVNKYKDQVDPSGLARTETGLKNINKRSGYSYAINQVQGLLGEAEAYKELKNQGYKPTTGNKYFDLATADGRFAEVRTRKQVSINDIFNKAILQHMSTTKKTYVNNNKNDFIDTGAYDLITPTGTDFNASGFIPNFAPPTSAIRIPWFKKFGNAAFDKIQPTLGISKASDVDTFRQIGFRSTAKGADENGDPNIFGPLYETFSRKALQLINKSNIFGEFVRGSVLQPRAKSSQTAFDDALLQDDGIIGLDFKGFPKKNLSGGSVAKHMNDKLKRVAQTDPEQAAKIKESVMVFNETGHENQLPSEFGKNFLQLAGTSYSQMLKNSPDLVKGLSAETNSLLDNYVKDPAFLAMNAAKGFVPNFAGKDITTKFFKTQTGPDLFSSKGTGLSGTVYRQPGYRSSGHQLKEQLNNMVMSILGNNVFFPDASSLNPKIYGDVNKGAENSAKTAALKLSSGGKTASLGLGTGMMSETFGNSRYVPDREAVFTGEVSGKMKRVNYDRLSDILGAFWSANPQTKSAWESLKNTSETGKFEEKQNIRAKTSLLKKAYEDFLIKNNYIGTRVKLSGYRKRAEGVEGTNYGALRSDLAGVSNVRNIGKYGGFIPNFAYKQAVMGLEESMSGNKAVLDTKSGPFPFIRNTSQSNFASAISDHGGLSNALSDSMRNQEAAGLMSKGFVPNFATVKSQDVFGGVSSKALLNTERALFVEMNKALRRLTQDLTLTAQQQQILQNTVQQNAQALQQATGSSKIVAAANNALVTSIQQNQDAQKAAAKAAKAQAGPSTPKKADQTLSTRIGGLFGGKRGAVRGRQFDRSLGGLSNNIGFTLAAPMVGGILESAIGGGKDRSEMGYGQRLASSGISAGLTGLSTGAAIGNAVPGIGTAAGAAIGAIVGFSGAMISAQTTLEDLSKSMSKIVSNNKSDIDSAKKLLALQTQLASESDPYKIMELKDVIEETSSGINNSAFADKILRSASNVDDFNKAVSDFSKSAKPIEVLERLPALIAQMSKELKISEQGGNMGAITSAFSTFGNFSSKSFKNIIEGDRLPFLSAYAQMEKEADRNGRKIQRLVEKTFADVSGIFLDLGDSVVKDKPELLNDYNDLIKNFSIYKDQGNLEVKLQPFVDQNLITQDLADKLVLIAENLTNDVFQGYLKNLSNGLQRQKGKRIETKANSNALIQDTESLKNVFSKINTDISKSLFETAINLENIEFKSSLDKLNFEKLGEIFDTSFSSIGKNLEESAKSQFELLSSRFKYARENSALLERDISFGETTQAKQKQFSLQRSERVSTFLEANLKNNPANRGAADAFIQQSKLIYDNNIENIKNLGLKQDETSKRALDKFVQEEKEKKATFDNAQKNNATLFNTEQTYAQKILKFKQKIAEADFKLDQRKLDNALKEKQVIESFNFANQMIQAKTQADVNMIGIAAEVNPNFNVGKSKFQQEDIRFQQEREKTSMQLAAGIRTSTNESRLADFQQRILADNTQATIENTNVIRDANLIALNERKSSIEQNVLNLQNTLSAYTRSIPQAQEDESYQNYVEDRSPLGASFLSTNNQNPFSANSAANFLTNPVDYVAPPKADKKSNPILGGAVSLISTQKDILMSFLKSIINGSEYPSKMTDEEYADVRRRGAEVQARQKMENDRNYVMRPDRFNFLETRYSEQPQRANEETRNIIKNTQSISSDDKPSSIYDALNLKEFKLPGPIDIIDDERTKALNQQLVLQEKNLGFITDQIDATYGLVDAQNKANKSLVERAVPDISKIGSVESELNSLKKSQEILIKARDISIQQLNTSQNLPSQTIADRNEQALLRQKILGYDVEINKVALTTATAEYRIAEEKKRQVDYAKYLASRGKFTTGVQKAMDTIKDETEMFKETLGTTTVNSFRDGLVGAMDAALNKADDLESALMGVAAGFLREIQGVMLRNIANQAISSFMPSFGASETGNQRGGFIRAQRGMYISGGRTGDKNPALLEDGEYVLNRNAVKSLGGPRAIDDLNFNAFPRFATGGDPGTMSASVSMNEPFERLSMYGREQSPEFQSYIEKLREEEAAKEKKRAERKALLNQFIGTLISTGVSMGISSAVGAAKNASQAKANLKGAVNTDTGVAISGFAESKKIIDAGGSVTLANGTLVNSSYLGDEAFTRSSFNQLASSRFSAEGIFPNRSGFSVQGAVPYGTGKNETASINKTFKSPFDAVKYSRSLPSEFKPNIPKQRRQEGGAIGFNQGGFLPYGSRLTDSIPAYLTGGEYVVNSKAVRKYGVGGLNRINSGVARFQDGGMVDAETGSPSNTSNTSNSNISINITVNASGGKVGDQESESNKEGTEGNAKELSNRIKGVVLDVITTEQRTGGLLDSTKKR
jgi:TP901 family phage tail tape measure protein